MFIRDYSAAHTLNPGMAELTDLPESDHVTRVGEGLDLRSRLVAAALSPIIERHPEIKSPGTLVIETGQARGGQEAMFGCSPLDAAKLCSEHIMISSACASGIFAVILAAELLRGGAAQRVLVLAAATPSRGDVVSFGQIGAFADGPSRPFDKATTGATLGSFAGAVLVTSDAQHAHLSVVGSGSRVTGAGAASVWQDQAATMLAAAPAGPDVVVAHGTGTRQGDRSELDAVAAAMPQWGPAVRVVSHKGGLGHTVHAAGVAALVAVAESVRRGRMHGSYGLISPIGTAPGVHLPGSGRTFGVGPTTRFLVNGFGFGGNHGSVLVTGREHP